MRAHLALVPLAFIAAATTARADERPVVVVDASADGRGAEVVARLNGALGPEPTLGPIAPRLIDALAAPTPIDGTAIAAAAAALADARERMVRFAYGDAAAIARAAQDALAGEAGDRTARELLANLAFVEGLAVADDSGLAAAIPTWSLVHKLSPARALDPAQYPPDQVAVFAAAVTPPPGSGAVMIAAPGATEILVDGEVVGREPAVAQLAPGPHIVTARGDDIVDTGRRVVATAGQIVRVDLVPVLAPAPVRAARARDRLRAATDDGQRFAAVQVLLAIGAAEDAILVVADDAGVATRLYTRQGGLGPARPVDGDLGAVLRPLRPVPRPPPRPPGPPGPPVIGPIAPEVPWHERRWVRVGMGVAGTTVVVAVIAAILTRASGTTKLGDTIGVD
ncbi:MAG: hypothetical protein IPL61_15685 [Myxococcales bacterium]|nr:hypothetical protein [Myxococcales bacterium]